MWIKEKSLRKEIRWQRAAKRYEENNWIEIEIQWETQLHR